MNPRPSRGSIEPADGAVLIRCRGVASAGLVRDADTLLLELTGACRDRDRTVARLVRVLAVGSAAEVDRHPAAGGAARLDLPDRVLLPGLVNAHAHLDLTHVGPRPFDDAAGFVGWIQMVRSARLIDPAAIRRSVRCGIDLSLAGGVVAVGDIAGAADGPRLDAWHELSGSPLAGVSYMEFFAIGTREASGLATARRVVADADRRGPVRLGLQPHAPYTVSPEALRWAIDEAAGRSLPLSIHLAESPEEHRVVAAGDGPFRRFLEDAGIWSPALDGAFGAGATPVAHLARAWADSPRPPALAAVHVNDVCERDLEALAGLSERLGLVVVYCPRASEYFRHGERFGPHPYRRLMAAGVPVALGTDSAINLPPGSTDGAAGRISTWDEMRLLHRRDGTDPATLLRMATTVAARALGLGPEGYELRVDAPVRGVLAVPAREPGLVGALRSDAPPELVVVADPSV